MATFSLCIYVAAQSLQLRKPFLWLGLGLAYCLPYGGYVSTASLFLIWRKAHKYLQQSGLKVGFFGTPMDKALEMEAQKSGRTKEAVLLDKQSAVFRFDSDFKVALIASAIALVISVILSFVMYSQNAGTTSSASGKATIQNSGQKVIPFDEKLYEAILNDNFGPPTTQTLRLWATATGHERHMCEAAIELMKRRRLDKRNNKEDHLKEIEAWVSIGNNSGIQWQ